MLNIFTLTTNKLVEHLKSGQISSVEVCNQYIERIEKFEKDVKAWEYFDKKKLLEKAVEADEYRKSGKPLGSL
ncbi:MAG: amidase, partial [Candidatus Pelagibacter ubique]